MKFHDQDANWFLKQMKANCAKIAEMNINRERLQTSAPGSSWRSSVGRSGVLLE